jgi:predicted nucleic-acid-binding Zn-ribbon protein
MKNISVFKQKSNEELQKLLDESSGYSDVLRKLDLCTTGGNNNNLIKLEIKRRNLSVERMLINKKKNWNNWFIDKKIPMEKILVENSSYLNRSRLKKRLISEGVFKYKCVKCGNEGEWLKKKLSLTLEHKNGVFNDNRMENLCFLCPNCHSQTKTFAGRNKKE